MRFRMFCIGLDRAWSAITLLAIHRGDTEADLRLHGVCVPCENKLQIYLNMHRGPLTVGEVYI